MTIREKQQNYRRIRISGRLGAEIRIHYRLGKELKGLPEEKKRKI